MLSDDATGDAVRRAVHILSSGGVVLYPTDTLYGLGVDALSDEAVAKIFQIKGRDEGKPVHAIVTDLEMAAEYGEIPDGVRELAEELPKGKITFIVPKRAGIDSGIAKGVPTFGFRIPDNIFCIEMVRALGKPVTATSANRAGMEPERSVDKILAQLSDESSYSSILSSFAKASKDRQNTAIDLIDLVIDAGELPARKASSVVDFSGPEPRVLREGAIPAAQVESFFNL